MTDATPRGPYPLARVLQDRLGRERLKPYRGAVGGDLDLAIRAYEWNSATAGAIFETLGHFEVLLRNALTVNFRPGTWPPAAHRPRRKPGCPR